MEHKRSARMTVIPQLDIPHILVDDEDDRATGAYQQPEQQQQQQQQQQQRPAMHTRNPSNFLMPEDALQPQSQQQHHRSWSGTSVDISLHDTNYGHPLSMPRSPASPSTPGTGSHRYNTSAFSFELQEPAYASYEDADPYAAQQGPRDGTGSNDSSRRTSAVNPAQLREMLDDSVWLASIRRSATQRRGDPGY